MRAIKKAVGGDFAALLVGFALTVRCRVWAADELQTRPRRSSRANPRADRGGKGNRMRAKRLTLQQRREIFLALVNTQDQNIMSVAESRQSIIKQYKITDVQLR